MTGLVEVRITGDDVEVDRPVPALLVRVGGTTTDLPPGLSTATLR